MNDIRPFVGSAVPAEFTPERAQPDFQGVPRLAADQLVRPRLQIIEESASVWTPVSIGRRTLRLRFPGQRRIIHYVQAPLPDVGSAILAEGLHATSSLGYVDLPWGSWMVNTPVVTAEGTKARFVIQDAALGSAEDAASSVGNSLADITTPGTPTFVSIPNADTSILAANSARKLIILSNPDAAISIWLSHNAVAAVSGSGVRVPPGGSVVIGAHKDAILAGLALRGIGSAAGPVLLGVQTYT